MNTQEKTIFINELIDNVKAGVLKKIDKYPDKWDGVELRWLVSGHFESVVFADYNDKRKRRFKDFENECLVNNLF